MSRHLATKLAAVLSTIAVLASSAAASRAAGPDMRVLFPPGGQRGTTVDVSLTGKLDKWPLSFWASSPGLTISPGEEKGKLKIAIAPDTPPGLHWIRAYDPTGASLPRPFVVGTLGEFSESEDNDKFSAANSPGSASVVVNGTLGKGGDVDHYRVALEAGQTILAALAGHETLGSPMDTVLHVVSPAGQQLAYNHDGRGLDPEITYSAPVAGDYVIRVFGFPSQPNSTISFAGSDQYLYRLMLTTAGFIDYPWPLAVTRDQQTNVELVGWNIPPALSSLTVQSPGEEHLIFDPQLANTATLRVEPHATAIEVEPNTPEAPQAIELPITITGRIGERGDSDAYRFTAQKGQSLSFELESRKLGYPLDAVLIITDATGKSLARIDDIGENRDAVSVFALPADGDYQITVNDLNRQGGSRYVYRLRCTAAAPSFAVTADANAYTITGDKSAEITLTIERTHGFAEPIEFSIQGLPETITATTPISAPEGDTSKTVKLTLSGAASSFSGPIRIEAKSTGSSPQTRAVTAAIENHTDRLKDLWLTVVPAPAETPKTP